MDAETLEALQGSIKKHENILAGIGRDKGPSNCPLCQLFWDIECDGCPISNKTGERCCENTPYNDWQEHITDEHEMDYIDGDVIYCPECERLVKMEIEFLKSLLPTTI
ncbi:MAG: hypothetical protein M0R80_04045 [Proteobacteria bacterium]|jgi:hypothetical protein|nr:hypothetical protein [Pseudomonadota bacterium]